MSSRSAVTNFNWANDFLPFGEFANYATYDIMDDMPPSQEHGDATTTIRVSLAELEAVKKVICGDASPDDRALLSGMVARVEIQAAAQPATQPLAVALKKPMSLEERKAVLAAHYEALWQGQKEAGGTTKPWAASRSGKPSPDQFRAWLDTRYPDRREIGLLLSDLQHLDKPAYQKVCWWASDGMAKETLQSFDLPSKYNYDPSRHANAPKSLAEVWARAEQGEAPARSLYNAYARASHCRP
jgi:hypothetical protein